MDELREIFKSVGLDIRYHDVYSNNNKVGWFHLKDSTLKLAKYHINWSHATTGYTYLDVELADPNTSLDLIKNFYKGAMDYDEYISIGARMMCDR